MKLFVFIFFLLGLNRLALAQVNADCIQAIPLCSNPGFTFFATSGPGSITDFSLPASSNISNPTPNPNPPNLGCMMSGELNPQWVLITAGNAGSLEFVFGAPNSSNPQVGFYDWIMWPYSSTSCAGILNNTLPPIRCNWNGTFTGGTGIASATNIAAVGGSSLNYETPLSVNACDQFILCISNYSGVNSLVSFLSLGTASIVCNPTQPTTTVSSLHSCSTTTILSAPSGFVFYQWMGPAGFISSAPVISVSIAGSYSLSYGNIGSCSIQKKIIHLTFSQTTLNVSSVNPSICVGETSTLNASGLTTYTWSSGVTGPNTTINPTITTVYSVSGTDTSGCFFSDSIIVNVSPCTDIEEQDRLEQIGLYPNPNEGIFEIYLGDMLLPADLSIMNLMGERIHSEHLTERSNRIMLNKITKGLYYYSISLPDKKSVRGKLIIE